MGAFATVNFIYVHPLLAGGTAETWYSQPTRLGLGRVLDRHAFDGAANDGLTESNVFVGVYPVGRHRSARCHRVVKDAKLLLEAAFIGGDVLATPGVNRVGIASLDRQHGGRVTQI